MTAYDEIRIRSKWTDERGIIVNHDVATLLEEIERLRSIINMPQRTVGRPMTSEH